MPNQPTDFLYAFVLDGKGGGQRLEDGAIDSWSTDDGTLWLHFDTANELACRWLLNRSGLPELAVETMLADETRPRTVVFDDGLLIVLRGVNTNPGDDPEDMVSVRIWIDQHRVVSTRRRQLLSVVDLADALKAGRGPRTSGGLLAMLVERIAARIGGFVDAIEARIDDAESDIDDSKIAPMRVKVASLRRQIAAVRRFLAPQRDALDRLTRQRLAYIDEADGQTLYQEGDRITRHLEDLDLARERTILLKDDLTSQIAEQQNSRMYVLSIVAAVFLPLGFITGLLGMNVGGLPGVDEPRGFLISVFAMAAAAVLLIVLFRWKRWL
ncbi:MAG: zinc transporter ZntB [Pseudomonadota bacterium]